jgi:hypothetical protein
MTDLDRQVRAEVLLLVQISERRDAISGASALIGVAALIEGEGELPDWGSESHDVEGAPAAAADTGVLPPDRVAWLTELDQGVDAPESPAAVSPQRRAAFERLLRDAPPDVAYEATLVGQRLGLVEESEEELDEDDDEEPLVGFKAVVPGPPERDGKRLVSVECYDGGLLVRHEVAHEVPEELRGAREGAIHEHFIDLELHDFVEIEDDVGTDYAPDGGGGSAGLVGGRWVTSSRWSFGTPVPARARRLTVDIEGTRFELDVAGVAGRPET